jgi:hypothetical protein
MNRKLIFPGRGNKTQLIGPIKNTCFPRPGKHSKHEEGIKMMNTS